MTRKLLGRIASARSFILAMASLATLALQAFDTPYLTFRSASSFTLYVYFQSYKGWDGSMQYSTDAANWTEWDGSVISSALSDGQHRLYLRGSNNTKVGGNSSLAKWILTGSDISCEGDIETLRGYDGNVPQMAEYCYGNLFNGCSALISAPTLSATTLASYCYKNMFQNCTGLTVAPELHAMTLATYCYQYMFSGCTALTAPPALPATTLAANCYSYMFQNCTSIKSLPTLSATTLPSSCYSQMFGGCTSLEVNTTAPGVAWSIPSEAGTGAKYSSMFMNTAGSFTEGPDGGVTYYVASALPVGEMYQVVGGDALDAVFMGSLCNIDLTSTIKNGVTPYTFSYSSGELPPGLEVRGSTLSGTPTRAGNYRFTLSVTDNESHTLASASYSLAVVQLEIAETTFIGADGSLGVTNCIKLTTDMTTLDREWYVVDGSINYRSGGIKVSGDVNLVLKDRSSLTLTGASKKAGINVAAGNSLAIYGQSVGETAGTLTASGNLGDSYDGGGAGIGGNDKENCGTITINGGIVTATGSHYTGAGIGGGYYGNGGTVTINGGVVTATGGIWYGAGIGGGQNGSGGTVTINGGTVTATGGSSSAGDDYGANGIGKGYGASRTCPRGTLTVAETVSVKAGDSENPTTELTRDAETGAITIGTQRYFTAESTGPVPLAQTEDTFAAYTGQAKEWNLADTISGGTAPYTFALKAGSVLPGTFTLSGPNYATLSGTVSDAGTYVFTNIVTDAATSDPQEYEAVYRIIVTAPAQLAVNTTHLGEIKQGKAANFNLSSTITGGVPAMADGSPVYTFAPVDIKTGFVLNNGVLSVASSVAAGEYTNVVSVTDSLGTTLPSVSYTLTVVESVGFIEDDPEEPESGVSVDCLTEDGVVRKRMCNMVTSSASAVVWNNSWYYVNGNVTLSAGATVNGKVSLVLADGATLTVSAPGNTAGISVAAGNTLTIYAQSAGASVGKLIATGGDSAAGIGGGNRTTCGKVNIYGGEITATGTGFGAGIGGGGSGNGGTVTINGGTVVASGGNQLAPGIGTANGESHGTLTVGANMVVKAGASADPTEELDPVAPGELRYFVIESNIPKPLAQSSNELVAYLNTATDVSTLLADTVTGGKKPYSFAYVSGTLPVGISTATLSGTPTAEGGPFSFEVRVTDSAASAQVTNFAYTISVIENVEGKERVTFPGEDGNPRTEWCTPITEDVEGNTTVLSTGWYVVSDNVTLNNHSLDVSGDVKIVLAAGKTLTVSGYAYYAGARLAGISVTNDNVLSIYGTGSLVASGTFNTPGIGGDGYGAPCGTVKIYGGNIMSSGDTSAAGIGGGTGGAGGTVEIYGGTITATGGDSGAGIGGGNNGNGGTVTIRGGTVTATGGYSAAGVGGGDGGNGAIVTIYGGTVTATGGGGYKVSGIGGNYSSESQGTLTTTANVTVKAGSSASPDTVLTRNASTGEVTLQAVPYYTVESAAVSGLQLLSGVLSSSYAGKATEWNLANTISGGTPPYSFALASGSSLPRGLELTGANNATLSGSVAASSTYNFTLVVTDSAETPALNAAYTLEVLPVDPFVVASGAGELGTVARGASAEFKFAAKVSGGIKPYSFNVAAGSELPDGLALGQATGTLSGAPTAIGEYSFTIAVSDGNSPASVVNIPCTLSVKERYTITYYESDGRTKVSGTMPIFYFGGEGAVLGSPFAKTGYIFAGWYANQDLETGGVVTEISASDSGNKVFYAKWTEKSSKMPVSFIGADGSLQEESCTVITSDMSELASGWYVVPENVTMDGSLYINGNVSIVLLDNVNLLSVDRLSDKAGICVTNGNSLTVYGQSKANTGRLIATGTTGAAGIGGVRGQDCGTVTIYGGTVKATGGTGGAGIGGGQNGNGGTVTIYGGTVEATGGTGAAGIGGGYNGNGGTVSIYGGTVTATGMGSSMIEGGAGIGGGCNRNGGTVAIYGGTVTATGYANESGISAGIGGADSYSHGTLTVAADIIVKAGASANPTAEKTRNLETGAITLNGEQYYTAAKGAVQYSITYMNGDTPLNLAPANYTYGTGLAELPEPGTAPAGCNFAGWYLTSDFTGAQVTSIGTEETGAITLYAKWVAKTETYKYTDGSGYPHVETCTAITNGTAVLPAGWYIVTDSLTLDNSVAVNGAVNLVLKDGTTLTVNGSSGCAGIVVTNGNSLTIFGESLGTGELVVTGGNNGAGIGGNTAFGQSSAANGTCGAVTINGGIVTATGGSSGAGIGGGNDGSGGTVVVNGGTVTATGGSSASSGIGCGTPALHSPTHGTLYVDVKLSVKAGNSSNPTENAIRDGLNYVTLSRQRYFVITPPPEYAITYYIDGVVTNLAPAKYTEGVGASLPNDLTKDGYTFDGWYTDNGFNSEKVSKILSSETGDRTFYAQWVKNAVPLSQTTDTLAAATVGVAYNCDLNDTVTGGTAPYTFALAGSSQLPHNFIFGSDGEIYGTTDIAGTYVLSVTVTDAASAQINAEYTLVVGADPLNPAPSQTSSALTPPYAHMNELYEGSIASTVSGGVSPYTFELAPGSWLPSGIELASDGSLSGMVTGLPADSSFSVIVTGANGSKALFTYSLNVVDVSASGEYKEGKERTWTYVMYGNGAGGIDGVAIYNDDDCALDFVIPTTYDVVIPSKIDGYSVKCIGDFAFYDRTELTGITIPDGVTSIGMGAFLDCENLTTITIPDSVTYVGDYAFDGCAPTTVYVAHGKTEFVSNLLAAAECDLTGTQFLEECVVTFDQNYGSAAPGTRHVPYGTEVGELPAGPGRAYATFVGWFTEATGGTLVDEHVIITQDVTFYAHWTVETRTVTFDLNGGTGTIAPRQVEYGSAIGTLPVPEERETYDFTGWYVTAEDGSHLVSETYVVRANTTLTAHWAAKTHTVTFEYNDGTGGSRTRRITHGTAVGTLPTDVSRTYYELVGWFTAAEGGDEVSAATLITAPVSFYAHWRGQEVYVMLNANGGTCAERTVTVRYQSAYGTLPTPTYEGHTFDGWFTSAEGGTEITAESILDSIRMTLYAHWSTSSGWPSDTSTVEGQTAEEAFDLDSASALADVDAKTLADWAKVNSVSVNDVKAADETLVAAYLLNCANTAEAVATATPIAQEAIKVTAITIDEYGVPQITCPETYGNGEVVVQGSASLGASASWHDGKQSTDRFFRTILKLK